MLQNQIESFTQKLTDSPKNASLYYQRGLLYWEQRENERALNDFYKMISYDSTQPLYYQTLAAWFVDNGNIERGIESLNYAIRLDPTNPIYHVLQGKYSIYIKRYQDAINHFNNALKQDIHNPEAYFYKGLVYHESNNNTKAISNLITATEQDPTWDEPFELLGEIYASQKNDLALSYFDNAARANPQNTSAIMQKAYYLKKNGRVSEAEKIYQTLVTQNPQNGDALYNLGIIAYDQKNYTKALKQFEITTKVAPTHALAYYMIGKSELALGVKSKAKSAFNQAYIFDTTLQEAKIEADKL